MSYIKDQVITDEVSGSKITDATYQLIYLSA